MGPFPILNATNAPLLVTNISGLSTLTTGGQAATAFLPLGTVGASATGELGLKVILTGSGAGATTVAVSTITAQPAAVNQSTGQVATSTTAATFVIARPTRRSVSLQNLDASINVFIGPATVTAANGYRLGPGQSVSVDTTLLIQVISASGTPTVAFYDVWD